MEMVYMGKLKKEITLQLKKFDRESLTKLIEKVFK